MAESPILFEEKQYLGYNKFSIIRRLVLAIFCFLVYFVSPQIPDQGITSTGMGDEAIFYMGILILVVSLGLIFVLHLHTVVNDHSIDLSGLWTARKVKIDLASIAKVERVDYSSAWLNRPVYNLHKKGMIRFYTRGNDCVELTDHDGLKYVIGSQRADELARVLTEQLEALSAARD